MRSRTIHSTRRLPFVAALVVVMFVAAQGLCFVHCHRAQANKAWPACHGSPRATAADGRHNSPIPNPPAATTTCMTLKTMLTGYQAPALVPPHVRTLYLLSPTSLALDTTEVQPKTRFSCHAGPRDWVITPEVCPGPACRSLAPPVFVLS